MVSPKLKPPDEDRWKYDPRDLRGLKCNLISIRTGIDYVASRVKANNPKETQELNVVLKNVDDTISSIMEMTDFILKSNEQALEEMRKKNR